jgi:hypothetical protein
LLISRINSWDSLFFRSFLAIAVMFYPLKCNDSIFITM